MYITVSHYKFKQCRNYFAHFKTVSLDDICTCCNSYVSRKVTEFKQKGTYATINTQYTYLAFTWLTASYSNYVCILCVYI